MAPIKLYYLSAEVAPFAETYELASFSRKFTNCLHLKTDIDIRVSQPKYGFISERKYILREVIRLRDLPIVFNNKKHIINIKSAFIPDTRVQVYFMENNSLYKELSDLIYKARNGRVFSDIDTRFSFFNKAALETLQSLFWIPDIILCNDWQTSLMPTLLKQKFINEKFYANMKSVYLIHSMNSYREISKSTFDILDIDPCQNGTKIDSHIQGMEYADLTIILNYESEKLMEKLAKQKNISEKLKSTNHIIIDIPKKTNKDVWKNISSTIETACRTL